MKTITKTVVLSVVVSLPVLAGFIFWAPLASAATITVDTTADENADPGPDTGCSLYEALEAAETDAAYGGCNAGSGTDTVVVPAGTYSTVINPLGEIRRSMSVVGDEDGGTIIDGNPLIINPISADRVVNLSDLTVQDSSDSGIVITGGSENYTINISRVTVEDSAGSGIHHTRYSYVTAGTLNITDSLIRDNASSGLWNDECVGVGTMYVTNTMVSNNELAGIYNQCGHVVAERVTVEGNSSDIGGGGVYNNGTLDMTNSTIFGNSTDAGGSALYNDNSSYGTLTNVTIANNSGSTAFFNGGTDFDVFNTLIVNNDAGNCEIAQDLGNNSTNNISSDETCPESFLVAFNPRVASNLADSGGSAPIGSGGLEGNVLTLALLADSPAIDAGNDDYCPNTDERDANRPDGGACDIGAYESPFGTAANTNDEADEETLADTGTSTTIIALIGSTLLLIGAAGFIKTRQM